MAQHGTCAVRCSGPSGGESERGARPRLRERERVRACARNAMALCRGVGGNTEVMLAHALR
eukprot:11770464-Alexandrium_andersonii.AAC.1